MTIKTQKEVNLDIITLSFLLEESMTHTKLV